jgi:hypothetical protein
LTTDYIANHHAITKKQELAGKIQKMAMVDNLYSYKEAKDKIDVLNKNVDILKHKNLNI